MTTKEEAMAALEEAQNAPQPEAFPMVITGMPRWLAEEVADESAGLRTPRSKYLIEILAGLGKEGRMDRFIQTKIQQSKEVSNLAKGIDAGV